MKKVILGLMVILLVGAVCAQNSFASSLISLEGDNSSTLNETTDNTSNDNALLGETDETSNSNTLDNNDAISGENEEDTLIIGESNSNSDNSLDNSFSYDENESDEDLPLTGLNNTGLVVLTLIALGCAVMAFKKISEYGNI